LDRIIWGGSVVVWLRNLSLRTKLSGLVGTLLALVVLLGGLSVSSTSGSTRMLVIVVVIAAVVLAGPIAFLTVWQITRPAESVIDRITAMEKAVRERLTAGLCALADGDLTIRLEPATDL
jgi:hypothetical protein